MSQIENEITQISRPPKRTKLASNVQPTIVEVIDLTREEPETFENELSSSPPNQPSTLPLCVTNHITGEIFEIAEESPPSHYMFIDHTRDEGQPTKNTDQSQRS